MISVLRLFQLVFVIGVLFGLFLPLVTLQASLLPVAMTGISLALLCLVFGEKKRAINVEIAAAVFGGFALMVIPMWVLLLIRTPQ